MRFVGFNESANSYVDNKFNLTYRYLTSTRSLINQITVKNKTFIEEGIEELTNRENDQDTTTRTNIKTASKASGVIRSICNFNSKIPCRLAYNLGKNI